MADTKISAMPSATTLTGAENVPLVQGGVNVQATTSNLINQGLAVSPSTSRTALGLGALAVLNTTGVAQGGTGVTSYTVGDTLYASGSTALSKLAGNTATTTKFLAQTGTGSASTAPSWSIISLANISTQYGSFYFDFSTELTGAISSTVTTIPVTTTSGFSSTGAIIIGIELITYTGITSTSFTGCNRGAAGSQTASHDSGEKVNGAQVAAANTSTLVQFNTTTLTNGVTLNTATQEISVAVSGTYNFAYSAQINNSTVNQAHAVLWFEIDGVVLANSGSWVTVSSRKNATTAGSVIIAANYFIPLVSSNKVTMKWLSPDGDSAITTYPSSTTPTYPASPAIVLTVNQVS